jgi:hypothetical protein
MKTIAVMIKGWKKSLYFEVDEWHAEQGIVRLTRYDLPGVIAAFPYENLLAVVDLTANGRLEDKDVAKKVKEAKGALSLGILANQEAVKVSES